MGEVDTRLGDVELGATTNAMAHEQSENESSVHRDPTYISSRSADNWRICDSTTEWASGGVVTRPLLVLLGLLVDGDRDGLGALDDGVLRGRDEHLSFGLVKDDVVVCLVVAGAANGAGGDEDHHPDHAQKNTDAAS